jgi:hypothetical protein
MEVASLDASAFNQPAKTKRKPNFSKETVAKSNSLIPRNKTAKLLIIKGLDK